MALPAPLVALVAATYLGTPPRAPVAPLGAPARAAVRAAPGDPAPAAALRVARAIAERWKVSPERIRLEWESPVTDGSISPNATVELWGSGVGGHWLVILRAGSGAAPVGGRLA